MVKGLFHTGHQIPPPVCVAKNGYIPVIFHWLLGKQVSSIPKGSEKPNGSSVQVRNSSFCDMTCLGVLSPPLGWDASPLQVTPSNCQVALTNWPVPFTLLGRERHCESKVSCLRT